MKAFLKLIILNCIVSTAYSQSVAYDHSFKYIPQPQYVRINYDNDFLTGRDLYYTQGFRLEWVSPILNDTWVAKLLLRPAHTVQQTGLAFEQDVYTPTDISKRPILTNDHPYCGTLYLQYFTIATDTSHKRRFSTGLLAGIMGPLAGAPQTQRAFHTVFPNNIQPQGWPNELKNAPLLNYNIAVEQRLAYVPDMLLVDARAAINAGTLLNKASLSATLATGLVPDVYYGSRGKRFSLMTYVSPEVSYIFYDATLQGGVGATENPYRLTQREIVAPGASIRLGAVLHAGNLHLEYAQTLTTRNFIYGKPHRWGSLQLGVSF